jgi:translation initiation factor IF-3
LRINHQRKEFFILSNFNRYPPKRKPKGTLIGRGIFAPKVLCIDKDNNNLGVINTADALKIAQQQGLDLVQVSDGSPPTCKIIDYGKYKYELSKKQKEAARKQREAASRVKEIKLRPSTDTNDLKIKAERAAEFLEEGHRVKITVMFKGREMAHKEIGFNTLNEFIAMVPNLSTSDAPSIEGRILSVMCFKKKEKFTADDNSEQRSSA